MPEKKSSTSNTEKVLIGATVAAVAAGAYFFSTQSGKRYSKKMKGWMVRMKGQVLEKLEEAENVTEPVYRQIVDTVADAEIVSSKIPRSEILQLATDLKKQWNVIRKLTNGKKPSRPSSSRTKSRSTKSSKRTRGKK